MIHGADSSSSEARTYPTIPDWTSVGPFVRADIDYEHPRSGNLNAYVDSDQDDRNYAYQTLQLEGTLARLFRRTPQISESLGRSQPVPPTFTAAGSAAPGTIPLVLTPLSCCAPTETFSTAPTLILTYILPLARMTGTLRTWMDRVRIDSSTSRYLGPSPQPPEGITASTSAGAEPTSAFVLSLPMLR